MPNPTPFPTYGADDQWASQLESHLEWRFDSIDAETQADNYTLDLDDAGQIVEATKATAMTITVPPASSVNFPVGTVIEILQYGAGQVTITPGSGVTIRSPGGRLKTLSQYSAAFLRKRATDEWLCQGDLTT